MIRHWELYTKLTQRRNADETKLGHTPSRHLLEVKTRYPVRAGVGAELLEQLELADRRRRTDGALLRVLATSGRLVAAALSPQSVLHVGGRHPKATRHSASPAARSGHRLVDVGGIGHHRRRTQDPVDEKRARIDTSARQPPPRNDLHTVSRKGVQLQSEISGSVLRRISRNLPEQVPRFVGPPASDKVSGHFEGGGVLMAKSRLREMT